MKFEGLTAEMCPLQCNADGCLISGKAYCGHPRKGGLHAAQMQDPDALRRAQQARDQISHAELAARLEAQKIA